MIEAQLAELIKLESERDELNDEEEKLHIKLSLVHKHTQTIRNKIVKVEREVISILRAAKYPTVLIEIGDEKYSVQVRNKVLHYDIVITPTKLKTLIAINKLQKSKMV
jgi:hypothetical protein